MSMGYNKCEVCGVQPPIGVASTIMPYSCAYCRECAGRFAQPLIVFETLFHDFGTRYEQLNSTVGDNAADELETYQDGAYISYRQWATQHQEQVNGERA